ncbi:MAG: hypothetical protein MH321_11315 [Leptospiraceae bacterium]|nr:hypothetical protein [Leptospiraceae bacterium]
MSFFDLKEAEIRILISLVIAGLLLFLLVITKRKSPSKKNEIRSRTTYRQDSLVDPKTKKTNDDIKVLEVFDYNGVKILHEDGLWTVNDTGMIQVYKDWVQIPPKYQKMVKELDNRSIHNKKKPDYFLEILNGFYYVSMPGGKKKKYDTFTDIPVDIRKFLGKS